MRSPFSVFDEPRERKIWRLETDPVYLAIMFALAIVLEFITSYPDTRVLLGSTYILVAHTHFGAQTCRVSHTSTPPRRVNINRAEDMHRRRNRMSRDVNYQDAETRDQLRSENFFSAAFVAEPI